MPKLTEEQIRAAALAKIQHACDAIQAAQDQLGTACSQLSALMYGAPAWKKCSKLYDNVHSFWYVVDGLRHHSKVTLDSMNIEALQARIDKASASPGGNRDASTQALSKPDDHPAPAGA